MKKIPNLLFTLLIILNVISCSENKQVEAENSSKNVEQSFLFIKLTNKLLSLDQTLVGLNITSLDKILLDSIKNEVYLTQQSIDSLKSITNLDLTSAESICRDYFGLNDKQLNKDKINYLFLFYGYKICGPGWVACGIVTAPTEELFLKRQKLIIEANKNYESYIYDILKKSQEQSFPLINNEELEMFEYTVSKSLSQDIFTESFKDSACTFAQNDSTFINLYSATNDAKFQELK